MEAEPRSLAACACALGTMPLTPLVMSYLLRIAVEKCVNVMMAKCVLILFDLLEMDESEVHSQQP